MWFNVRSIEQPTEKIRVGADVLLLTKYEAFVGIKKLGVIANPTSVLPSSMEHIVDRMHEDEVQGLLPVELTAVFGPEHGFRGDIRLVLVEQSRQRIDKLILPCTVHMA